jgi:hypothetical protein
MMMMMTMMTMMTMMMTMMSVVVRALSRKGNIGGAHALLDELLIVERTVVDGVVVVGALGEVGLALEHLLAVRPAEAVAALQMLCLLLDLLGLGGEPADKKRSGVG